METCWLYREGGREKNLRRREGERSQSKLFREIESTEATVVAVEEEVTSIDHDSLPHKLHTRHPAPHKFL